MNQQETVATELKTASVSLLFAINAIECGDWVAAEQSMVIFRCRLEPAEKRTRTRSVAGPITLRSSDCDGGSCRHPS